MEDFIPETVEPEYEIEKENIIIETKSYDLLLLNEKFELIINLYNAFLEFKLQQKDIIQNCYYREKYDIQTINELLNFSFKTIRKAFDFYDKALNEKKVSIIIFEYVRAQKNNFLNNSRLQKQDIINIKIFISI